MGKLTNGFSGGVGRNAILALIDELNDGRARAGMRERYEPVLRNGELTMGLCYLETNLPATTPSRYYANNYMPAP